MDVTNIFSKFGPREVGENSFDSSRGWMMVGK
jgi:hypothetical protein